MPAALGRTFTLTFLFWVAARADDYPRQPQIHAEHYILRVALRDESNEIQGDATVAVRFLGAGVTSFRLDLATPDHDKGMTVTEVRSEAGPVEYTHRSNTLTITLAAAPAAGELRRFEVKYHGVPANGLQFVKNKFGERCIFSLNWPTFAREWLPIIDHPSEKATSEFLITAPAKYQVVANGKLEETVDLGDGQRLTHWKQSMPIASWLNDIGVAQFAVRNFATHLGVPLSTWVFHQDRDAASPTFDTPLRQAFGFYSDSIGPYPYEKLAGVEAAGFEGGMEHATAIFFGENAVKGQPQSSLVWHEVAHQWFGDSVTEGDWDDAWLSEGFATYFALLSSEHFEGRDAFVTRLKRARAAVLKADENKPVAVVHDNLPEIRDGRAPVAVVYQKGAWVLHMLRGEMGTDRFWEGIRTYYRRYRDGNASTADLRRVMEEVSRRDLGWFFDQWLYRAGEPAIEGGWHYDSAGAKIMIDLRQTQPRAPYRLPIEVGIGDGAGSVRIERLTMTQERQSFEFAAEKAPVSVELDPNTWVLMQARFGKE